MLPRPAIPRPALLILLSCLLPVCGCGVQGIVDSLAASPNVTGNWQIQSSATGGTGTPTAGLLLLGDLESSGSSVSGTFRLANLAAGNACGIPLAQVVTVSGKIDSTGNMTLTSAPFGGSTLTVQLLIPKVLTSFGTGTIAVAGGTCIFPSSTAIGAQTASVTGTYSGIVTASTLLGSPAIPTGTSTLTLTQSPTPQSDGQFPLTGSLAFAGGGCTSSVPVTGTVSGGQLTLASAANGLTGYSADNINGFISPTATQLPAFSVVYGLGPCNAGFASFASYSGPLNRQ